MFKLAGLDNFLTVPADLAQGFKHRLSPSAIES